jgi:hypothetical protein
MVRPREHDRDQIALDLIEWARQPDSINFNKFCCTREPPIPASKLLLWAKEDDSFRTAYETAKAFLGCRREEWLSQEQLHVKAYDLNATVYDLIAKEEKIENSERDAKIKANALKTEAQANAEFTKEISNAVLRGKKAIK